MDEFRGHMVCVEIDMSNEIMGKKVWTVIMIKIFNIFILGEWEMDEEIVMLCRYG